MRIHLIWLIFAYFASAILVTVAAQDAPRPSYVTGEVTVVTDSGLEIKNDKGTTKVKFETTTEFKRVPPDRPSITA
ncbi:MAG TPA: hypothetical protein DEP46_17490, partial [Blastocatellia bacterium]|nr:hypothetical protein [Blastocatellia bacterium]